MFMQIWDYQILTLKILLKCVGLRGNMQVWVNQILTLKDFSTKWSQHFDFLPFNSTINLNN